MKRLNPLNDYLFQKYLGEKGDEEQLLSFLNAVLYKTGKEKLVHVEILENKTLTADIIGSKTSILDIRAIADNNTRANIEIQLKNIGGNMDRRSLFYWSREYSKSISAGQEYTELPNVIAVNITNFEFIRLADFHTTFHLWEDSYKDYMLTDALEIHFVDMVKFKRQQSKDIKNNPLHRWMLFFDKDTPEEVLKEIFDMEEAIKKANEKITYLASDEDAIRLYEMREMAMFDYTSGMNSARREGIAQGRSEGITQGESSKSIEIATNLIMDGVDAGIIAKATGLDESAIVRLKVEIEVP